MDTTCSKDRSLRPEFAYFLNLLVVLTITIAAAGSAHAQVPALPMGWHDGAGGSTNAAGCTASGWAVDPDDPYRDLDVRILADGIPVATTSANLLRTDVGACPDGTCGFAVKLWGLVSAGVEHVITAQAYDLETQTWVSLQGTPKTLTCWGLPEGSHDGASGIVDVNSCTAFGWAVDPDNRDLDVSIRVLSDGAEVATATASDYGEDMARLGICPGGTCRFTVNLWGVVAPDQAHQVTVQAYDPGTNQWWNLEGTPKTLTCSPPPPNPFMIAFPENDAVEAWEWPDGSAVHLSIDDPATTDSPDYSADGTMAVTNWGDPRTYFRFEFADAYDLKPGDVVTVTDGQRERSHTVLNLSVTGVSASADTVAGTADAGAQVDVWPHGFDQTATVRVTAGEAGAWLADLSGLFDIVAGTGGRSRILDEAGNSTAVDWNVPMPWFTAFPEGDQVEGWDWPLGANMALTIDDPSTDANPDFSKEATVELAPWGSGQLWVWFEFRGAYDLKPGDIVTLTDGVTSKTHVVQNLSVTSVNVIENTVTGTADAGANVTLWAWEDPEGRRLQVTADVSGMWAGDFDDVGYDVRQYNTVRAEVWDEFGDDTAVDRQTDYNYDIYIYDPLIGGIRQLTNSPDTDEYNPSWSPNGKLIAHDVVVRGVSQSISITDAKTGISTPLRGAEDGGNDAVWSPNGKWIAFDRYWAGGPNLYIVPATGGDPTVVREDAIGADWAPNGKRLVFQQPSDGSIRTVAVDGGSGNETLIAASGANPVWSPDGNWIAYENDGNIWKRNVNVQGTTFGEPIQVTSLSAKEEEPSWSADSQTIAFQTGLGGDYEIWTVPAAGGEATWLVGAVEYGDYSPAYAKNGPAVAYAGASAEGLAARTWVAAYTHEPGPWSEGTHSYHFADSAGQPTPYRSFEVLAGAPAYDGHVLLRPFSMRVCADGALQNIEPLIAPDQPTLFHIGYVTDYAMTYPEAQAYFNSLAANVAWDGGEPIMLVRHEIMPYQVDGWLADMCAYAQP